MGSPAPTIAPPLSTVSVVWDPTLVQNSWLFFTLCGWKSPGTIAVGGVRGFRRRTGWEKRRGKGSKGADLVRVTAPPCEGSILLNLSTEQDLKDWDNFVENVLTVDVPTNDSGQALEGLPIYYPAFSSVGLNTVIVEDYSPPEHRGKGLYQVEIRLCEWQAPPPQNISAGVGSTAADKPDPDEGDSGSVLGSNTKTPPPNPKAAAVAQLKAQIKRASGAGNAATTTNTLNGET